MFPEVVTFLWFLQMQTLPEGSCILHLPSLSAPLQTTKRRAAEKLEGIVSLWHFPSFLPLENTVKYRSKQLYDCITALLQEMCIYKHLTHVLTVVFYYYLFIFYNLQCF